MITCAKDKRLKIWSLPRVWYDEEEVKSKVQPPAEQPKPVILDKAPAQKVVLEQPINPDNPLGGFQVP